eukprot:3849080-Prymnesium_polylepis.1
MLAAHLSRAHLLSSCAARSPRSSQLWKLRARQDGRTVSRVVALFVSCLRRVVRLQRRLSVV